MRYVQFSCSHRKLQTLACSVKRSDVSAQSRVNVTDPQIRHPNKFTFTPVAMAPKLKWSLAAVCRAPSLKLQHPPMQNPAKARKADYRHEKTDRNSREQQQHQGRKAQQSDQRGSHRLSTPRTDRTSCSSRYIDSSAQFRPMPVTNGWIGILIVRETSPALLSADA